MQKVNFFILTLLFPIHIGFSLCDICTEEMEEGPIHSIAYDALDLAATNGLFSPYMYHHSNWVHSYLEQCSSYSIYREKFHYLMWWADIYYEESNNNLEKEIKQTRREISKFSSWKEPDWEYINKLEFIIRQRKEAIASNQRKLPEIHQALNQGLSELSKKCIKLYTFCIENHKDRSSYYQRSLIYRDQGKSLECVEDLSKFLETSQQIPKEESSSNLYLIQGAEFSDLALYNQAIEALSEAIRLDPGNKEAFLERAVAYFEIGNFDRSIEDFLACGYHNKPIPISMLDFASGFIWGASNGFIEAVDRAVPSLLASAKGLGNVIWALTISPEQFSSEFMNACTDCIKFLMNHSTPEVIEAISPNLKELIFEFDSLSNLRRGELLGHLIGKDGIEIFATAGALKVYQELRKANMIATLETLVSSTEKGKILEHAGKWGSKHSEITNKIKVDEAFIKTLKKQNFSESTIRKTIHELGYKTFPRPEGIPENFKVTFSDKKIGMKYIHPTNEHSYVRVMPGNPASPNEWQHNPYINHVRDGNYLDKYGKSVGKDGKKVTRESREAHIPLKEFNYLADKL